MTEKLEPLLEKLAELEHEQWMSWSKYLAENEDIQPILLEKWRKNWKPYSTLSEEIKEKDRKWARKIMRMINERYLWVVNEIKKEVGAGANLVIHEETDAFQILKILKKAFEEGSNG